MKNAKSVGRAIETGHCYWKEIRVHIFNISFQLSVHHKQDFIQIRCVRVAAEISIDDFLKQTVKTELSAWIYLTEAK